MNTHVRWHWLGADSDEPEGAGDALQLLTFAGGEPHVNVRNRDAIDGADMLIDARVAGFADLGSVLVLNDALRRSGARTVALACPYLPGARQDRSEGGGPLTAKVYADIVNAAGFDHVIVVDPHSPVITALLDNCAVIGADQVIDPRLLTGGAAQPVVLVCPDAGAAKRTEAIAEAFSLDIVYGRKHRNPRTGELGGFSCGPVPDGAVAVIVDDICDGGGTFIGLAAAIGLPAEQLRLWTTHGIYAKGLAPLHEHFALVGCTDSFPSDPVESGDAGLLVRPIESLLVETATRVIRR